MNQNPSNSVEKPSSYSLFQLYWVPHPGLSGIFSHRLTKKQIQCHILLLPLSRIEGETALLSGRTNNKHPFICCAHFFHQFHPIPPRAPKHQQEMCVYTDRMLPLAANDWTQEGTLQVLAGLKRLVMIYGPFRVSEGNFGKNEIGQVKVWISREPQKSHPDHSSLIEHDTVASLVQVLTSRNGEVARKLRDCKTIRESIQRLSRTDNPKAKHRHTPSIVIQPQDLPLLAGTGGVGQGGAYQVPPNSRGNINSEYPKYNSLWNSKENIAERDKLGYGFNSGFPNRSISFLHHKTRPSHANHMASTSGPAQFRSKAAGFTDTPPPTQSQFATGTFHPHHNPQHHPAGFSHRGAPTWRGYPDSAYPSFYDITIINNNVSNYISHYPKACSHQEQDATTDRNRNQSTRTPEHSQRAGSLHSGLRAKSLSKTVNRRKRVPSFISTRMKMMSSHEQSYQNSNEITRLQFNSDKIEEPAGQEERVMNNCKRKDSKIFTFCQLPKDHQPETTVPEYFTLKYRETCPPRQPGFNLSPARAKTQSNFFPANRGRKLSVQGDIIRELSEERMNDDCPDDNSWEKAPAPKLPDKKKPVDSMELKRMLKQEYQSLLGFCFNDKAPDERSKSKSNQISNNSSSKKLSLKESMLQDKIKNKQLAFAELKMEALKVLTDF